MNDIVADLRAYAVDWRDRAASIEPVLRAANEIDRLRAVVANSAEILKRNLGHQTEKCYDALSILQRAMPEPEIIYNPDDWEASYDIADKDCLADDVDIPPGQMHRFKTLVHGPDKFAVCVVLSRDESGDPEDTEIQWFDNEGAAKAACEE